MSVSQQLAEYLASARFEHLPPGIVEDTRRAVLDWLGSALAGSLEPPARMIQRICLGASNEATVFSSTRASAPTAALQNGVASHILEFDDVHKGSTLHAAAPIIPAALAVAEREHSTGRDFLLAVALGYEAAFRIGEAVNPSHYRHWHPTGTVATFGAAAAAGSILQLDAAQMLDALGSAGTQAAGLWEFNADGAMSKHLHPGKAAFNGILSADLARVGFTGATRILEGERGFFAATSTAHDTSKVTHGLGQIWKIAENCYKMHSCCGHTHTAIDVALDLRQHIGRREVAAIEIETYGPGYEIVKEMNPQTSYQAKFSIAYCVAAVLTEGRAGLEQFSADRTSLISKTRVRVADDLTAKYPAAWPVRVKITLGDGAILKGASDYPRGNPENPVSTPQLEEKFVSLVEPRFGDVTAQHALAVIHSLENIEDMAAAFAHL
jgi:2-methylcitrate dehydratase PrpD